MRWIIVLLLCLLPLQSWAATITVGAGQTYTTIAAGRAAMSGGDTMIIKDGTYAESFSTETTYFPNGTAGAYTIIKAENDGGVVITGQMYISRTGAHTSQYLQIEGLKFTGSLQKEIRGNRIKFLRCAFEGGPSTGNVSTVSIGTSDYNDTAYILLEDCWTYGAGGRYNVSIFNSDHVVLRRVVARHDGAWTDSKGDPEAAIAVYNSSHTELQNVIAVDSNLSTYHTWDRAFYTIFNDQSTGAGGVLHDTNNVNWTGAISLNNQDGSSANSWCFESDGGGPTHPIISSYTDVVCWSNGGGGFAGGSGDIPITPTVTRGTFGSTAKIGSWQGAFAGWATPTAFTISDTLVTGFGSADFGSGVTSATYNDRYNNGSTGTCTNCQTYNPQSNGLLYLPRIETGSNLKTAGSGGGQIGATILKRVGVSGTLWGENGYNTVTSDDLWPWPYEARIKADMAAVSTRGFSGGTSRDGGSQTLTKYVWEYLGNTIPSDIYGDPDPINGTCGTSNGQSIASAPTTNLCTTGTASSVSGTGPWSWTCAGSDGGSTASCSASVAAGGFKYWIKGLLTCAGCR